MNQTTYQESNLSFISSSGLLYVLLRIITSNDLYKEGLKKLLQSIIIFSSIITAVIAIGQYFFFTFYQVGQGPVATMGNSGAVASFLVVSLCFLIPESFKTKSRTEKTLILIVLTFGIIALVITKARAAWLALIIVFLLTHNHFYKSITKRIRAKSSYRIPFIIVSFVSCIVLIFLIYYIKADSADGRLFIWARTFELIIDNPVIGIGINNFEAIYPTYQAAYFVNNPTDPAGLLAGDISHPFNDYLSVWAETGTIGILLLCLLIFTIGRSFRIMQSSNARVIFGSFMGLLSLGILALFTYPLKMPSLFMLMTFFIVFIAADLPSQKTFSTSLIFPVSVVSIILCLAISISEIDRLIDERAWKRVFDARTRLSWRTISTQYDHAYKLNSDNGKFLYNYGAELVVHGDFSKGLIVLDEAKNHLKPSTLFMHQGLAWESLGYKQKALKAYEVASHIIPHKFYPKYRLVFLHDDLGNRIEALNLAKEIVQAPAKVKSDIVLQMKSEMREYLNQNKNDL